MPPRSRSNEAASDPTPSPFNPPEPVEIGVPEEPEPMSPLFSHSPSPNPDPSYSSPSPDPSPSEPGDDFGSDPRSTDGPRLPGFASTWRKRKRDLIAPAKAAVATAGGVAHQLLTVDGTAERHAGLFLPDEEDLDAIAEPLAGLASRRVPDGAENPDVTDVIGLLLGVVGYVVKQLSKRAALRNTFAGQFDPEGPAQDDQEPADQ